jgi:hypothetical protein
MPVTGRDQTAAHQPESEVKTMAEDPRSCGSIACIINAEGRCWCGLQWNGAKMVRARLEDPVAVPAAGAPPKAVKSRSRPPAKKKRTVR